MWWCGKVFDGEGEGRETVGLEGEVSLRAKESREGKQDATSRLRVCRSL